MAKTKYGHFIKKLVYNELPGGAKGKPEYITWPKGSDLEGLNVSFVWGYHNKVGRGLSAENTVMSILTARYLSLRDWIIITPIPWGRNWN